MRSRKICKCSRYSLCRPLCIKGNSSTVNARKVKNACRVGIRGSASICRSVPACKGVTRTSKCIAIKIFRYTVLKFLSCHCASTVVCIKAYVIRNTLPTCVKSSIRGSCPSVCTRKVCVVILRSTTKCIIVAKEDVSYTSRNCSNARHNCIISSGHIILIYSSTVCIEGNVVGVNIPCSIEGCCRRAIPIVNVLHAFVVILRSLTVRLGEVSCESITCSRRCGCYGHRRSKGCINSICATCAVLLVKRYGYGVSNPLCIKCSVFRLVPNLYACHGAIVVLNAIGIVITIKGISCIRIRCNGFRHSRAKGYGNGVSTTIRTVSVKSYAIDVSFPLRIQGDNITLCCCKVENLVCVVICCTCSVGVRSPTNKGISNSRKKI